MNVQKSVMDSSILTASSFEIKGTPELIEKICQFVQEEITSPSLPPLPILGFWMENGNHFSGIPLKLTGKDPNRLLFILTSDPVERPINTIWIPFSKVQTVQVMQAETISHLLITRKAEVFTSGKVISLASIRSEFEVKWKALAFKNSLLPYIYLNWDEIGNTEFEKQNIIVFVAALLNAIDIVTSVESKRVIFNRLKTLQVSSSTNKEVKIDRQGAFLMLQANFLRAPSLNIEKELVMQLNDSLAI